MLPPTLGSFGWSRLLPCESCDVDELWSNNMEPGAIVALCVVMKTLQKDRLLVYLFNELLLFMMLYNLCADTTHTQTNTKKRRLFHQNMLKVLEIWQNMTDMTTYVIFHRKRILPADMSAWTWSSFNGNQFWVKLDYHFPTWNSWNSWKIGPMVEVLLNFCAFCLASLKLGRISSFSSRPSRLQV